MRKRVLMLLSFIVGVLTGVMGTLAYFERISNKLLCSGWCLEDEDFFKCNECEEESEEDEYNIEDIFEEEEKSKDSLTENNIN